MGDDNFAFLRYKLERAVFGINFVNLETFSSSYTIAWLTECLSNFTFKKRKGVDWGWQQWIGKLLIFCTSDTNNSPFDKQNLQLVFIKGSTKLHSFQQKIYSFQLECIPYGSWKLKYLLMLQKFATKCKSICETFCSSNHSLSTIQPYIFRMKTVGAVISWEIPPKTLHQDTIHKMFLFIFHSFPHKT